MPTYKTTRDIIIPAGTDVIPQPPNTNVEYVSESALVLIEITPDVTASWTMDLEEAIETGLVMEEEGISDGEELDQGSDQEAGAAAPGPGDTAGAEDPAG